VNESGDVVEGVLSYAPGVQAVMPNDLVTLADLEEIPKGEPGERGPTGYTWTITQPDDPGDPANFTQPWPYNVPLWVDTSDPIGGTGESYAVLKYWDGAAWAPLMNLNQDLADVLYVHIAGSTMEGPLVLHADPTAALEAATKQYVDDSAEVSIQPDVPVDPSIVLWVDTDEPTALDALAMDVSLLRAEVQELRTALEASRA
jgi:hypothetical protein